MAKRILVIGAGIEQVYAYKLAKRLSILTVGTDMNPDAPAFEFADDKIIASTRDAEGTWKEVKNYVNNKKIDGVMTLANDVPYTVAYVASKLGLPSILLNSARLASDKLAMKNKFFKDGVVVPEFCEIESVGQLKNKIKEWRYPVIIKPIDNRGARGVLRLTEEVDLNWAFQEALNNSDSGRVMVEKFIEGPQISTEGFVLCRKCYTVAFSDRNYEYLEKYSPYIIENGGTMPSNLPDSIINEIAELMQRAADSLGIKNGPAKGDIVVDKNGKPYVIEIAARLSGGYFCTDQIPLAVGVDLVRITMLQALGEEIDRSLLIPQFKQYITSRYLFPAAGIIKKIEPDRLWQKEYILRQKITASIGQPFDKIVNSNCTAGYVIVSGKTYRESIERANNVIKGVRIYVQKK